MARIQLAQTSMIIRQIRAGVEINERGLLPSIFPDEGGDYITTTIFVKYHYRIDEAASKNILDLITIVALPNGMLQEKYNPTTEDTIWVAGPNAPTRGEEFRTRLSFSRLQAKARWRVQKIEMAPEIFQWDS